MTTTTTTTKQGKVLAVLQEGRTLSSAQMRAFLELVTHKQLSKH